MTTESWTDPPRRAAARVAARRLGEGAGLPYDWPLAPEAPAVARTERCDCVVCRLVAAQAPAAAAASQPVLLYGVPPDPKRPGGPGTRRTS